MRKLKLKELNRLDIPSYTESPKVPIVVVLDDIRSAYNVGSIFRSADAMAVERIVLCGITAQPPSREITKTAIGATESVDWSYESKVADAIRELKSTGYKILAIEQTNKSIEMMSYELTSEKIAIVLGNEVKGVSDEALALTDQAIEIAQFGTKHSLNVSVCGGIVLHHFAHKFRAV